MLDGFRPSGTDLKVLYKVLENDNSTPFDDIGWRYFNTDGSPDIAVGNDARNFKEYNYTQEGLAEFSAFAIKIVGQSTNTSTVPLVSNLRAIALAT
jgi:diaminopimelate epimerase